MRPAPLAALALFALAPLAGADSEGILFSGTFEGPIIADGPVAAFTVPDGFVRVTASIADRHSFGAGVAIVNEWTLRAPDGRSVTFNNDAAPIVLYLGAHCPQLECHEVPGGPGGSTATLDASSGEWRIEYRGATSNSYSVLVVGER